MIIDQLSVFLENRNGQLEEITKVLYEANININAIHIAETNDYGILRMITEENEKAVAALSKNEFIVSKTKVVSVAVPDIPGGLHSILENLNKADIGIEYMYSVFGKEKKEAIMVMKVSEPEKAEEILFKMR